jgi:hypothetical protein
VRTASRLSNGSRKESGGVERITRMMLPSGGGQGAG